jgi:hypothetical protein
MSETPGSVITLTGTEYITGNSNVSGIATAANNVSTINSTKPKDTCGPSKSLTMALGSSTVIGAGSPTITNTGGEYTGIISMVTGTGSLVGGVMFTISALLYPSSCTIILYPSTSAAATANYNIYTSTVTASTISISTVNALAPSTSYGWHYQISGF